MATEPEADAAIAELLRAGRPRTALPLPPRERLTEAVVGGAFLVAALSLALLADAERDWHAGQAIVLTLLFAAAMRVHFDVGAGYTVPTQLVFVPMLLLLPTPWVPLLVAAGVLLGLVPDVLARRAHPDRLGLAFGNSWFAIGPALVLVLGHAQTPDWGDWPIYLLALVAQFLVDLVAGELREAIGRGIAPRLQLRLIGWVQAIDALLAPLGLLAAFASLTWDYAFLLLVPPAALLAAYSRERTSRLQHALALADAAREREELIAAASHELVTPVAVLTGIGDRLARPGVDPARQAEMLAAMRRELAQLRHRVRQFADFTRMKTGRELRFQARPTDVAAVAHGTAEAFAAEATVRVVAPDALPLATVDPDRLHQMLMSLVLNAVKLSPPGSPVVITASAVAGGGIEVAVEDSGPGIPAVALAALFDEGRPATDGARQGAGLGLYLTRELATAQGASIRVDTEVGRGSRFTLVLPQAQ